MSIYLLIHYTRTHSCVSESTHSAGWWLHPTEYCDKYVIWNVYKRNIPRHGILKRAIIACWNSLSFYLMQHHKSYTWTCLSPLFCPLSGAIAHPHQTDDRTFCAVFGSELKASESWLQRLHREQSSATGASLQIHSAKRVAVMTAGVCTCLNLNNAEVKCLEEEHEVLSEGLNRPKKRKKKSYL